MSVFTLNSYRSRLALLLGVSGLSLSVGMAYPQSLPDCTLINGVLPAGCEMPDAGDTVSMPVGENVELNNADDPGDLGFAIAINGETIEGDPALQTTPEVERKTDIALAQAEVQVRFDGLDVRPRLDLGLTSQAGRLQAQSYTNYPAWIARAELRVITIDASGRRRTQAIVPITPNGQVALDLPQDQDVVIIHRAYDRQGRFNETTEIALDDVTTRQGFAGIEEGADRTARQGFRVSGGAVTVAGRDVQPGARVTTLGEQITPAPDGSFVLQRILPAGDHGIDVRVNGAQQRLNIVRDITIPTSEWFYVGVVDLTLGRSRGGSVGGSAGAFEHGRIAGYANGKTASGTEITLSIDTGEEDLGNLLRNIDEKDPRSLLLRFDDDRGFPVYGDDSRAEDDAPTSGKFYVRVERDNNYLLWGNYQGRVASAEYLRNDRTLYGLQGHYETSSVTADGVPRAQATIYAAQPDNLPGRDVFVGTGGSVYFLQRQDISLGSETIFIEVVDPQTGRVSQRVELVAGTDYDINYLQGQIVLSGPLSGYVPGGLAGTGGASEETRLVVNYEFTPTTGDLGVFSYGGRVQAWANDKWQVGVTGMVEDQGTTEHKTYGADLRYQHSEGSWAELEWARSVGSAAGSGFSADGGFIINTSTPTGQRGQALRFEAALDLADIDPAWDGQLSAYGEHRSLGFSTASYDITADETLWGVAGDLQASQRVRFSFAVDRFASDDGNQKNTASIEADIAASDRLHWRVGLSHLDQADPANASETGERLELAIRADIDLDNGWTLSPYALYALHRSGGLARDDRYGVALGYAWDNGWSAALDLSDGTKGTGLRATLDYQDEAGNSRYFGYELTPDRALNGTTLQGRDLGRAIAGGKRRVNDQTLIWGETSYDLFGEHRALTAAYGIEYEPIQDLQFSTSLERGEVRDTVNGNFERTALSLGMRYDDGERITAKARLEWRQERGIAGTSARNVDSFLVAGTLRYKLSDDARFLASLHHAETVSDNTSFADGSLSELTLGYAYRPVDNDRLNTLFKYTYLRDMYGQQIDGSATTGPRQESHVLNWDVEYDLNRNWSVGGKIGVRDSKSAASGQAFVDNDASLVVLNARYHVTHNWDALLELRQLDAWDAGLTQTGGLISVHRHVGNNLKLGVGYNFSDFSDDLTDLTYDDRGVFINLVAKF